MRCSAALDCDIYICSILIIVGLIENEEKHLSTLVEKNRKQKQQTRTIQAVQFLIFYSAYLLNKKKHSNEAGLVISEAK